MVKTWFGLPWASTLEAVMSMTARLLRKKYEKERLRVFSVYSDVIYVGNSKYTF